MRREDYIFTVGYDGDTAIVDGKAKRRYGKLKTAELLEAGLFKPAFCSALFSGDKQEIALVIEAYNRGENTAYSSEDDLKRLFGVYEMPGDITKIKVL
ncbi:MAG: hypothetical protein JW852_03275 [Spirochaetales bacterium]|nr:hypothetical protein [Spirochaetales bacterium]